jgi:hypothetical protein
MLGYLRRRRITIAFKLDVGFGTASILLARASEELQALVSQFTLV